MSKKQRIEGIMTRNVTLNDNAVLDKDERRIKVSFSSEAKVKRASFFEEPWFEVLVHHDDDADLSRLNAGAPVLYNHDRSQEVGPAILIKNYGSMIMGYVRHKEYTQAETLLAALYKLDRITPHIDDHKGFDWRALHAALHFYFNTKVYTSPFRFVPRSFSPSIFYHCTKRENR